ncbi:hypothetical protein OHA77_40245 [Streptosporangium sp. NBC_01639]|nr:hypothetical protein OHA77_40245 [Streptosporangium sp. NBC_01639]
MITDLALPAAALPAALPAPSPVPVPVPGVTLRGTPPARAEIDVLVER